MMLTEAKLQVLVIRSMLINMSVNLETEKFSLYFDGRNYKTFIMEDTRQKVVLEVHAQLLESLLLLLSTNKSQFLTFVKPHKLKRKCRHQN